MPSAWRHRVTSFGKLPGTTVFLFSSKCLSFLDGFCDICTRKKSHRQPQKCEGQQIYSCTSSFFGHYFWLLICHPYWASFGYYNLVLFSSKPSPSSVPLNSLSHILYIRTQHFCSSQSEIWTTSTICFFPTCHPIYFEIITYMYSLVMPSERKSLQ